MGNKNEQKRKAGIQSYWKLSITSNNLIHEKKNFIKIFDDSQCWQGLGAKYIITNCCWKYILTNLFWEKFCTANKVKNACADAATIENNMKIP